MADRSDTGDRFDDAAVHVAEGYGPRASTDLLRHHCLALVGSRIRSGRTEVTIATDAVPDRWPSLPGDRMPSEALLAPRTDAELAEWLAELDLDHVPPVWAGREAGDEPSVHGPSRNDAASR